MLLEGYHWSIREGGGWLPSAVLVGIMMVVTRGCSFCYLRLYPCVVLPVLITKHNFFYLVVTFQPQERRSCMKKLKIQIIFVFVTVLWAIIEW